jgi:hypothetical protein
MTSPAARAVYLLGVATIVLILAVSGLFVWLFLVNRHAVAHNRMLIAQLNRETARQDAQFRRGIYVICIKLGEEAKSCKALARGLLLPKDFDTTAIVKAGRVEKLVGPQGLRGLPGLSRIIFRAGLNGSPGSRGARGLRGPPGPPGPRGVQGSEGPRGQAGANGKDGAAGARGPQGPPGARGSTGPVGARGPTGPACFPPTTCRPGVSP